MTMMGLVFEFKKFSYMLVASFQLIPNLSPEPAVMHHLYYLCKNAYWTIGLKQITDLPIQEF